jgi:hypothetical protein
MFLIHLQNGLDMSPSLFEFFASKDVGVFYMVSPLLSDLELIYRYRSDHVLGPLSFSSSLELVPSRW